MSRARSDAVSYRRYPGTAPDLLVKGCAPKYGIESDSDVAALRVGHIYKLVTNYGSMIGDRGGAQVATGKVCCPLDAGYPWKSIGGECISVTGRAMGTRASAPQEAKAGDWANADPHSSFEIHTGGGNTRIVDPEPTATAPENAKAFFWGPVELANQIDVNSGYPQGYGTMCNPATQPPIGKPDIVNLPQPLKGILLENNAASKAVVEGLLLKGVKHGAVKDAAYIANVGNLTRCVGGDSDVGRTYTGMTLGQFSFAKKHEMLDQDKFKAYQFDAADAADGAGDAAEGDASAAGDEGAAAFADADADAAAPLAFVDAAYEAGAHHIL
eukprot:tig00000025_g7925.t1